MGPAEPQQPQHGQYERHKPVADTEERPDRVVGEGLGDQQGEQANGDHADEFEGAGDQGDAVRGVPVAASATVAAM